MASALIGFGKVDFRGKRYTLNALYELPAIQEINQNIQKENNLNGLRPSDDGYQVSIRAAQLTHKESLALINGTTVMNALGALAVHQAEQLMERAVESGAMFAEALCARSQAFDDVIHIVRRHQGQRAVGLQLSEHFKKSQFIGLSPIQIVEKLPKELVQITDYSALHQKIEERIQLLKLSNLPHLAPQIEQLQTLLSVNSKDVLLQSDSIKTLMSNIPRQFCEFLHRHLLPENTAEWLSWKQLLAIALKKITPQDAYSVRCMPQVFGASLSALNHVKSVIEAELNAVVDNPIIFMKGQQLHNGVVIEESRVLSGGNFHGQPLALVLDYLKLAIAELGNMLERQICKLNDKHHNDGLPLFLVEHSGINSGVMMGQYAAAALVSENKVLVHPASADSIPTSANQEDHVSMGTIAGRQALEMIGNVEKILAIHLITSKQALEMRMKQFDGKIPLQISTNSQKLMNRLEAIGITYYEKDRFLYDDIDAVIRALGINQFTARS